MNVTPQTTSPETTKLPAGTATRLRLRAGGPRRRTGGRIAFAPLAPHRLALAAILGLSAALNAYELSRNAWANNFYSAGVRSMLLSLHNFLFTSFDPGGLISLDKPPLSVWVQAVSAKLFGFTPLALLLPEALAGVLCVGVLYLAMVRPFGRLAALLGALCLAVFPAFVAVSRDNNPDALLILLMTLSCLLALRAIESGRWRSLIACAVAIGLAFETKALAAYLVVPGTTLGYLVCAPGPMRARVGKLLAAGLVLAAVSIAWMSFVDLTPSTHRPYVGGSLENSELGVTFAYNGFGRIGGQTGGPGSIPAHAGAQAPLPPRYARAEAIATRRRLHELSRRVFMPLPKAVRQLPFLLPSVEQILGPPGRRRPPVPPEVLPNGRAIKPTPFGRAPGPLRLLEEAIGAQAGWLLPFSLCGLIAIAALLSRSRRRTGGRGAAARDGRAVATGAPTPNGQPRDGQTSVLAGAEVGGPGLGGHDPRLDAHELGAGRRDPKLAGLIVLGGWFLVEASLLSLAKGIVHPYYTSALAPGACAMVGAGLVALAALLRRDRRWAALLALAIGSTVATQIVLLNRSEYMRWMLPVLLVAGLGGVAVAALLRRWATWALSAALAALLIAPTGFAAATWGAPVQGTFPVAGPWGAPGYGGIGLAKKEVPIYRHLLAYLRTHGETRRFSVLTVSSVTAAPLILMGSRAAALGGYSGTDPALTAGALAHLVERHEARYVLLGGPYSSRGGNGATVATLSACRYIPSRLWGGVHISKASIVLFDCGGRAPQLWAAS
jgi:4-amino-4-deoxy-L-arabinose transferase-like glycosyltransferase